MGDNARQSKTIGTNDEPMENNRKQGEARKETDTACNTGTHGGRPLETIETSGNKISGRQTHHPQKAHVWGTREKRGGKALGRQTYTIQHQGGQLKKALRTQNSVYTFWEIRYII